MELVQNHQSVVSAYSATLAVLFHGSCVAFHTLKSKLLINFDQITKMSTSNSLCSGC